MERRISISAGFAVTILGALLFLAFSNGGHKKEIPYYGIYSWSFEILGRGVQKSTFTFFSDSLIYKMEGDAYTTSYTQIFHQYDSVQKRLITRGKGGSVPKDGLYFVMFFKDSTDSTLTIYKHECSEGMSEAKNFKFPESEAAADHSWNIYTKQ